MLTRKRVILGGVVAVIGAVALGAAALYYTLVPHDAPARATLSDAVASINDAQSTNQSSAGATDAAGNALEGTWVLVADGTSFVGYRVREELASVGTFTAVGRTQNVQASLTVDGLAVTDVQVSADLTGLTSDSNMRDGQLRRQALETNTYPTATFSLAQPITLNEIPAEGETVMATALGNLTLHGVTRSVAIPLEAQLTNGFAVVVGSLDIAFADFGIQKPTSGAVLGVEDHGLLELQLVFKQTSQG